MLTHAATGEVVGVVAATPGLTVLVSAPPGTDTTGVPAGGVVVAWATIADPGAVGGVRVEPVFLADGRAWTPDQYRAAYGQQLEVRVRVL
ncbi:MAG TPA: hypothetical protein VFX60_18235 [Micromonospora sp.]|nr:hypothetical protein [Micromonospora sp.]